MLTEGSDRPAQPIAKPLQSVSYYSVEYPGYVQSSSVPLAIRQLGGQATLDSAFRRTLSKSDVLIELNFRPDNPFSHPIPGDVVPTQNLVLKVVKRRRKRRSTDQDAHDGTIGEYTADVVGVITKTVRFRGIADYQYQPNREDPISKLRYAMDEMDIEGIQGFTFPPEREDYVLPASSIPPQIAAKRSHDIGASIDPQLQSQPTSTGYMDNLPPELSLDPGGYSNLRLFPPPIFSRQTIPHNYNFKANPASMETTVIDEETGEEKKRLINRMRWRGYGPPSISFADEKVPDKPPQNVENLRSQVDSNLLKKLQNIFSERPAWTRMALYNQFTQVECRELINSKVTLPLVCYVFQDGPWRDTLIRYGYDPRKDSNARLYQRLYFRNANHHIIRTSVIPSRQDRLVGTSSRSDQVQVAPIQEVDKRKSHMFDGVTLTKETAAFQLCDITDSMLKGMIEESEDLRNMCDERDGWYTAQALERIKMVLRHKFFSLLDGYQATDEECTTLLSSGDTIKKMTSGRNRRLIPGKHNMAKGALRPEDAAALRLRAAIDKSARNKLGQK